MRLNGFDYPGYAEALALDWAHEDGKRYPVIQFQQLDGQHMHLIVYPVWREVDRGVPVRLVVPQVIAQRYPWDDGIFGWKVVSLRGVERFCHPLLVSPEADLIAASDPREARWEFDMTREFSFTWLSWFGRVRHAFDRALWRMSGEESRPTSMRIATVLQQALAAVLQDRDNLNNDPSLPLTSEPLMLRHRFEIELGYPDLWRDQRLYQDVKGRFLAFADQFCDLTMTGKNRTGRHVVRVRPEAPRSWVTGRPLADYALAVNAMDPWDIPIRAHRENRHPEWLPMATPIAPVVTLKGVRTPACLLKRMTLLNVAFINLEGRNVFTAGPEVVGEVRGVEQGDRETVDGLLVTPSGERKLLAYEVESGVLERDRFQEVEAELKEREGFEVIPLERYLATMANGQDLVAEEYRYRFNVPSTCGHSKIKLLYAGLKAVGEPYPQLWAKVGAEWLAIDLIVAEDSAFGKGGRAAMLGALAGISGLKELDPAWDLAELGRQIEVALHQNGLPLDGRFPVYRGVRRAFTSAGPVEDDLVPVLKEMGARVSYRTVREPFTEAIVGPVPAVRAVETEERQSNARQGISINPQARNLMRIPYPAGGGDVERVTAYSRFYFEHVDADLSGV